MTNAIDTSRMSAGKRAAFELTEAAREAGWRYPTFAGGLFLGRFSPGIVRPYPDSGVEPEGEAFLERLESYLLEEVDADEIDRTGEIPDRVFRDLAAMGAFGIKIPKRYGGLGLSQRTYTRSAILLGSHCGSLASLISAHQSIGIAQPILLFGTEEQKAEFLPQVAAGDISAFALTETTVGSDAARMQAHAEPTPDGRFFVLNGEKLWCTNGTRARWLVVMARTPAESPGGRAGITTFIVDTRWPGVEVVRRCHFMGLKALYNGVMRFTGVRIPRENVLGPVGKGLRVALTTLNTGRLTLPGICIGTAKRSLYISRTWARERVQWGAPVGEHAAIADKIGRMASTTFAMDAMSDLTSMLVDIGGADIRIEAAISKMYASEAAWRIADETVQVLGGRGYETAASLAARGERPFPAERTLRDNRINTIFEGSSEILRLFIAREVMDPHLSRAGAVMNPSLPLSKRLATAIRAGFFYVPWYLRQWLPAGAPSGGEPWARRHLRFVARSSRRLARSLFHAMLRYGPGLEKRQMLLWRFVDFGAELYAQVATVVRAEALIARGERREDVLPLVEDFCAGSRIRIEALRRGLRRNEDAQTYALAQGFLKGDFPTLLAGRVPNSYDPPAEVEVPAEERPTGTPVGV
ncbi:MAG: acyl-CoA dehydrogenase family protein [Acidobacteria bacterium]|nr:acyl-CoA dehydrogenase family protein [Acidobacteriota bacterium]MYH22014.1 DNA polymerase II [Acidobacteriota bacterium]MYK79587.1 DNA polymerase II [Acidobacteriota bacterium]